MRQDGASKLRDEILTGFSQLKSLLVVEEDVRKQARGTKWRA